MRTLGLLLAVVCALASQPAKNESVIGGITRASLSEAEIVVVGEIIDGSVVDDGAQVSCKVVIRAEQVLQGESETGVYRLEWKYNPLAHNSPSRARQIPKEHGLWFLVRSGANTYRPLILAPPGTLLAGFFLPMPRFLPGWQALPPDSSAERKLGLVLGSALEVIASEEADRLNANWQTQASGAGFVRLYEAQLRFQAIAGLLTDLKLAESLPVYSALAASPYPNLRTVGLSGLLRSGDLGAALAVEKDAASLAPTLQVMDLGRGLMSISGDLSLPFVLALARAVIGEAELIGLDSPAAFRLGWVKQPEVLPYFAVMLESPSYSTRGAAILGICTAIRPSPGTPPKELERLWMPQMEKFCPRGSPISDRALELQLVAFWKSWWAAQRIQFERDPTFPRPQPPSRYAASRPDGRIEVPMSARFRALVTMLMSTRGNSKISGLLEPEDDARLDRFLADIAPRLDAQQQRMQAAVNASRIRGEPPDHQTMQALSAEHDRIFTEGMDQLRGELSPAGWAAVEKFLREMHITGVRLTAP